MQIGHFLSADTALVREASRTLTNMAAVHDNHPPLMAGGTHLEKKPFIVHSK